MPAIKSSSIRELKERISIYDVVSQSVSLKRAGSSFKGLSPFNDEKTPSFFISPDKNLFKCFSSGKAGDIITFVMETERLTFTEAVENLSRRFNIELEYEQGGRPHEDRSLRQELFDLHEFAAEHFHQLFLAQNEKGAFIRDYWVNDRSFPLDVAENFKIGFAPPDGGNLDGVLRQKKFSLAALQQSGLLYARGPESNPTFRPRFRGRLMIPIRDHQSRVIAFTARQLSITPKDDPSREAKYINSPETPIFIKGNILFNLDRARLRATPDNPFLLVEGQLDAIRCHQVGLTTAIAPQGTGITPHQLSLIRRYEPQVECLLDGDDAGQKAALRMLPIALKANVEVRFLVLPPGQDPDLLLKERGASALDELRKTSLRAIEFAAKSILPNPSAATPQEKAHACEQLFAVIEQTESDVAKAGLLDEASKLLNINPRAIEADFQRYLGVKNKYSRPAQPAEKKKSLFPGRFLSAEEDLLQLCLHFEEFGNPLAQTLHHEWIDKSTLPGQLLDRFLAEFEHENWPGIDDIDQLLETPEERSYISSLIFDKPDWEEPTKRANEGIRAIFSQFYTPKIEEIELEIATKQETFDDEPVFLLQRKIELKQLQSKPPQLKSLT
jgi:DNA primase